MVVAVVVVAVVVVAVVVLVAWIMRGEGRRTAESQDRDNDRDRDHPFLLIQTGKSHVGLNLAGGSAALPPESAATRARR